MNNEENTMFQAYKALAEKLNEENISYRTMMHRLVESADTFLIRRGSHRWAQQGRGTISHGYPSISPKQLCEEKLGSVGYCWEEYGEFAVVSERIDPETGE